MDGTSHGQHAAARASAAAQSRVTKRIEYGSSGAMPRQSMSGI
jgi:hypothetical protein